MEDNRYTCHEDCRCTHDTNNMCDGNCLSFIPNIEDRQEQAKIYKENN